MARKARSGRGSSRTPTTIDLVATPEDGKKTSGSDTAKPATTSTAKSTAAGSASAPKPEPVAMNVIERNVSALGQSKDDGQVKTSAKETSAQSTPETAAQKPADRATQSYGRPQQAASAGASASASAPSNRKGGSLGAIGAGLIGGAIALIGGAALQWGGLLPSFGSVETTETPQIDLTPLEGRIAELQAELERVSANANGGAAEAASAASEQAANLQANVDGLQTQLEELRSAMSAGAAGEAPAMQAVSGRVDGIEQSLGSVQSQLDEMAAQLSGGDQSGANSEAVTNLTETVSSLQSDLAGLSTTIEQRIGAVETTVATLDDKIEQNAQMLEQSDAGETVARAVAAAGLKTAIDRGLPFMAELETFASVGGAEATIATLRDYAASGVPTQTQLVVQFQPVARQIVATGEGISEDASIADRLFSSARSLVQIRPVGEVEGDKPGAIAARLEERLKDGNIAGALAEWEMLPEAAKAETQAFADKLSARETVNGLVADLLDRTIAQTTGEQAPAAAPAEPAADAPAASQ